MSPILIIVVLLLLFGGVGPWWGYSANWGHYPVGGVGIVIVILLVLLLMGRI